MKVKTNKTLLLFLNRFDTGLTPGRRRGTQEIFWVSIWLYKKGLISIKFFECVWPNQFSFPNFFVKPRLSRQYKKGQAI